LRHLSWRSSVVAGPTLEEADSEDLFAASLPGYEVDLDGDGTAVMLRRFDDLVARVRQAALNYELSLQRGQRFGVQLDLLAALVAQPRVERAVRHVLRPILRGRTFQPRRAALARLLLGARAVEMAAESALPLRPFPTLEVDIGGGIAATAKSSAPAGAALN